MHVAIFVLTAYAAKATVCILLNLYQLAAVIPRLLQRWAGILSRLPIIFWIRLYRSIHHQRQTLLTVNHGGKPHTRNVNRRCCARNTPVPRSFNICLPRFRKPLPTTLGTGKYGTQPFPNRLYSQPVKVFALQLFPTLYLRDTAQTIP